LTELGCDAVQGYYIMPPASITDLKTWVHANKHGPGKVAAKSIAAKDE
jgi:EAL domain-containing protein (putative c-di-GMP-specific phosphodiesterase class I)